jgi:phosphomannomutase
MRKRWFNLTNALRSIVRRSGDKYIRISEMVPGDAVYVIVSDPRYISTLAIGSFASGLQKSGIKALFLRAPDPGNAVAIYQLVEKSGKIHAAINTESFPLP